MSSEQPRDGEAASSDEEPPTTTTTTTAPSESLDLSVEESILEEGRLRLAELLQTNDTDVDDDITDYEDEDDLTDEDEDEDEDEGEDEPIILDEAPPGGFPRDVQRALWRVILGDPARLGPESSTHEELMQSLRRTRRLINPKVDQAMSLIQRGNFVPEQYAADAYMDCPLAVELLGFNISAPHIHATCLEYLNLESGNHYLDVGSGCGIVTCYGAYLVGKEGSATGIEINDAAIELSSRNLETLKETNREYEEQACEAVFEKRNVFLPDAKQRTYDRINVAGACPLERVGVLLDLLNEGGRLVVPSGRNGSELQLYSKELGGKINKEVILHVRFGELEVPLDSEIVGETLRLNRIREREELLGRSMSGTMSTATSDSNMDNDNLGNDDGEDLLEDEDMGLDFDLNQSKEEKFDCMLVGRGGIAEGVPANKRVLSRKCMLFKAQFSSGMKDAGSDKFVIPDHFSPESCRVFVDYLYGRGKFSSRGTSSGTCYDRNHYGFELKFIVELLQLGTYVSCINLCKWCETMLEHEICSENCVELLMVADEASCTPGLLYSCLNFIVEHYEEIKQQSNNFEGLESHLVKQIAERAAKMFKEVMNLLDKQTTQAKASRIEPGAEV